MAKSLYKEQNFFCLVLFCFFPFGDRSLTVLRNFFQRKYTLLTCIGNSATNWPCAICDYFDEHIYCLWFKKYSVIFLKWKQGDMGFNKKLLKYAVRFWVWGGRCMDGSRLLGCLLKTCGSETYAGCSSEKIDEKSISLMRQSFVVNQYRTHNLALFCVIEAKQVRFCILRKSIPRWVAGHQNLKPLRCKKDEVFFKPCPPYTFRGNMSFINVYQIFFRLCYCH